MSRIVPAAVLLALALTFASEAKAQATHPDVKERIARRRAGYARVNQRHQEEVAARYAAEQFAITSRMKAVEEARASQGGGSGRLFTWSPRTMADGKPLKPDPRLRPDRSGPIGIAGMPAGAPIQMPYSKHIYTGERIPTAMIPEGYGRFYSSIGSR